MAEQNEQWFHHFYHDWVKSTQTDQFTFDYPKLIWFSKLEKLEKGVGGGGVGQLATSRLSNLLLS